MAGRPPKPPAQKALESKGSAEKVRLKVEVPPIPRDMSERQKEVWRPLIRLLKAQGTLTKIDTFALQQFCTYWVMREKCAKDLEHLDLTFMMENGYEQQRPEAALLLKFDAALSKLQDKFGMTPAARERLDIGVAEQAGDPTKELRNRRAVKNHNLKLVQ